MTYFSLSIQTVRRTLPLLGLLFAFSVAAWAQPDGPPPDGLPPGMQDGQQRGPNVERELKQLTQLLALTTDQQAQVRALLTDQKTQIQALFQPPSADSSKAASTSSERPMPSIEEMQAQRAAVKGIREATRTKIAALLTDDQKTKYAAWLKKKIQSEKRSEDDMPPPPPDGMGGPPPDGGGGPGGGGPGGGGPPDA